VALIAIIVVAAVAGSAAYTFWLIPASSTETIKIGICGDLDNLYGKTTWQGAVLAAEQVNAQGGILGKNFTIVAEDDDSETPPGDIAVGTNALTKLITVDKADYIYGGGYVQVYQDICSEHQKIYFCAASLSDNDTQRVLDNYSKYKYFFRPGPNASSSIAGMCDSLQTVKNYTGFTKVALLVEDLPALFGQVAAGMKSLLPNYGFDVVYYNTFPPGTTDFTSYYAAIEDSGAQILSPLVISPSCYSLVKEYAERQSPFVMWGYIGFAQQSSFWSLTEGKCEYVSFVGLPIVAGYPLTNKTLPTREAYIQRWGEIPNSNAASAYDVIRFILPDAIKRAGTTETEAVIKTLETTNIEVSGARHFVFTSSHDGYVGLAGVNIPSADYMCYCLFQWQANSTQVPVYPTQIVEEAGATFQYPNWTGPWSNKQTP
jgi:branched-chain amino acid transport system substrate-binding protein